MKRTKTMFLILSLLMIALFGCQAVPTYEDVSTDKAKQMIDEGKVVVLDVRTKEEYDAGHIPGAQLLPVQVLHEHIDELNENEHYLIVCRSGNRSVQASELLLENGFQHIYNLELGMNDWRFEIEK